MVQLETTELIGNNDYSLFEQFKRKIWNSQKIWLVVLVANLLISLLVDDSLTQGIGGNSGYKSQEDFKIFCFCIIVFYAVLNYVGNVMLSEKLTIDHDESTPWLIKFAFLILTCACFISAYYTGGYNIAGVLGQLYFRLSFLVITCFINYFQIRNYLNLRQFLKQIEIEKSYFEDEKDQQIFDINSRRRILIERMKCNKLVLIEIQQILRLKTAMDILFLVVYLIICWAYVYNFEWDMRLEIYMALIYSYLIVSSLILVTEYNEILLTIEEQMYSQSLLLVSIFGFVIKKELIYSAILSLIFNFIKLLSANINNLEDGL